MVERVHGGIRLGVWVEQEVRFVKLEFDERLDSGGIDSGTGVVNSVLEHAIETIAGRATILGISRGNHSGNETSGTSEYDVMLGYAQGHGAAADDGVLYNGVSVSGLDNTGSSVSANLTATFALFDQLPKVATGDMSEDVDGLYRPTVEYGHPYE